MKMEQGQSPCHPVILSFSEEEIGGFSSSAALALDASGASSLFRLGAPHLYSESFGAL
jgi:hypothetical protein